MARLDLFQALPGVLVEVAHDRVGHGAAPDLHGVKAGLLVKRQQAVHLGLVHARGELRLLPVAERQVADQYFFSHLFPPGGFPVLDLDADLVFII